MGLGHSGLKGQGPGAPALQLTLEAYTGIREGLRQQSHKPSGLYLRSLYTRLRNNPESALKSLLSESGHSSDQGCH